MNFVAGEIFAYGGVWDGRKIVTIKKGHSNYLHRMKKFGCVSRSQKYSAKYSTS